MSSCLNLSPTQKSPSNIVESLFSIPGASAGHKGGLRVKLVIEGEIGLLLRFYRY